MLSRQEMDEALKAHPEYQRLLFGKGFLITNRDLSNEDQYPYNSGFWIKETIGTEFNNTYYIWHDKQVNFFYVNNGEKALVLIGHAYNPVEMVSDENMLLSHLINLEGHAFWEYESHFTGIYVMCILDANSIKHWGDCTCMRLSYYGVVDGYYYISSHAKLVGDLLNLQEDPYITRLKNYKHFHYFGNILPGDLSPFIEFKRVVANHVYEKKNGNLDVTFTRFFPFSKISECKNETEYQDILCNSSLFMKNTMTLCAQKWAGSKIAISLTGGRDSAITLASTNGVTEAFEYFSYDSSSEETFDVLAAQKICNSLGLNHTTFKVPYEDEAFPEINLLKEIQAYNAGNIIYLAQHSIRTRAFFLSNSEFDIEVKSWVDEIGRARYCKRFNRNSMPKHMTPRMCTSVYKVFTFDRKLVKATDNVFEKFINKYIDTDYLTPWQQLYWEFAWGAGEASHMVNEHMIAYDVTIPFNNRSLCILLLSPSLKDRIADRLQKEIVAINYPKLAELNINVVDANHTNRRAKIERLYFEINSRLPF